ncbi:hypothetical protein EON78_05105 [bacterium]|nr:MAG: hypothetical protein EON78_05105 [bacterium]
MEEIFIGIAADVSDRSLIEGWVDDKSKYDDEIIKAKSWTLLYAIPTIILLVLTIKSIRRKE